MKSKFMRKAFCILAVICLCIFPQPTFANSVPTTESICIPMSDIANSDIKILTDCDGEPYIMVDSTQVISTDGVMTSYKTNQYAIFADSDEELFGFFDSINDARIATSTGGSGTYNDSEWFYGSSLCISSTLYYTTFKSSGIVYGKINKVDVSCSSNSGTSIDEISLYYGELGFKYGGGWGAYNREEIIANNSTTYFPSAWPNILWAEPSATGASVTVTVHRNGASSRQYTFYNYILGNA